MMRMRRRWQNGGKTYPGGFYTGEAGDDIQWARRDKASPSQASRAGGGVEPVIDQWYVLEDTNEKFVVTDYDEQVRTVKIQTSEGDSGEIDLETWRAIAPQMLRS